MVDYTDRVKENHSSEMALSEVESSVRSSSDKSLLRFITCGDVDDGKSTLIGRLLYDSKLIFDDQLEEVQFETSKLRRREKGIDFSLLVDGLEAEREQGITIDVAYRYFSTDKRKFIVADTPGHLQYIRNMLTGASTADLAVILVDACKGISTQTKRHTYLAHLIGIRHFILLVNKMDAINYEHSVFRKIVCEYEEYSKSLGIKSIKSIPISALNGDNIISLSENMPWYSGETFIGSLENANIESQDEYHKPFRMFVQLVIRTESNERYYAGQISSGTINLGQLVKILPSGVETKITKIISYDKVLLEAIHGQSVSLGFEKEVDCSRGDLISISDKIPLVADQFEANFVWLSETPMVPGVSYLMKIGTKSLLATISQPSHIINVDNMERLSAKTFRLNEVGGAKFTTDKLIAFEPYNENRTLGGFILIDRITNATVAVGMINFSLRRSHNIHWQTMEIGINEHSIIKGQKPKVIWLTGVSGSGKTTIANIVETKLYNMNRHTFLLDGDNVRHGLNKDLGFTKSDRIENIRRVSEVSKLMYDAGLIVIAAFISPYESDREKARKLIPEGDFIEVFIDAPFEIVEKRDPKGLYKKARLGELKNFTGIDSEYQAPKTPEIKIDTSTTSAVDAANIIVKFIEAKLANILLSLNGLALMDWSYVNLL